MYKKFALVTGGSKGIGRASAVKLAEMGYNILINYHTDVIAAENARAAILQNGVDVQILKFDVSKYKEVDLVLNSWIKENPGCIIEVLVNNVGYREDCLFGLISLEKWNKIIDINLNSFLYVTQFVIKSMIKNKYGRIISVSSLSGLKGVAGQVAYSAGKGAIISATRSLAAELGSKKITVNVIVPGYIKTDMISEISEADHKNGIALKRFGEPEEVAELVGFIASGKSSYITGQDFIIDGGIF